MDPIERQAAIDAVSRGCKELRGIFAECEKNLNELPPAESSIPISWIEKYIDCLNGLESPFSTITALQVSLMVKRWKGDCPLPVNFFPDGKRKENTNNDRSDRSNTMQRLYLSSDCS